MLYKRLTKKNSKKNRYNLYFCQSLPVPNKGEGLYDHEFIVVKKNFFRLHHLPFTLRILFQVKQSSGFSFEYWRGSVTKSSIYFLSWKYRQLPSDPNCFKVCIYPLSQKTWSELLQYLHLSVKTPLFRLKMFASIR